MRGLKIQNFLRRRKPWLRLSYNTHNNKISLKEHTKIKEYEYLNTLNFRAPLIFAQEKCAEIKGARKWPIFAHSTARKLNGARNRNQSEHLETSI